MEESLVKESEEVLKFQGSHVIKISFFWLNMITMIKVSTHLLRQCLWMLLLDLILEFSEFLDYASWNLTFIVLSQCVSYKNVNSP